MKAVFSREVLAGASVGDLRERMLAEALAIHDEDVANCRAIGRAGGVLIPDGTGVLTHCNAGGLATAGYGTALGVIRAAVELGRSVWVCRRDSPGAAGGPAHGLGTAARRYRHDGLPTHGGRPDASGHSLRDRGRDGSRPTATWPTDRHLHPGGTRPRPRPALLCRRPALDHRPSRRQTGPGYPSRSAIGARSRTWVRRRWPPTVRACSTRRSTSPRTGLVSGIITEKGVCRAPYTLSLAGAVRRLFI